MANDWEFHNRFVRSLVALLAARNYSQLESISGGVRLSAQLLETAVKEYGRTVIPLPAHASELITYVAITGSNPKAWSVWVPLFTAEEGRSDLTLELTLTEVAAGTYQVELDNLRVP